MILPDVNVLVYAFNEDARDHARYAAWLAETVRAPEPYAISELVLSAVVRVATNPRILERPAPIDRALHFADGVMAAPNCVRLRPGPRHWSILASLCRTTRVSGSEWITADRGFARFPGLRWRHPLADVST